MSAVFDEAPVISNLEHGWPDPLLAAREAAEKVEKPSF
jgi:hypothetical protein